MPRRIINLILALGLTLSGAYGVFYLLFFAAGWRGWMVMGSGFACIAALIWLYADYIEASPNEKD